MNPSNGQTTLEDAERSRVVAGLTALAVAQGFVASAIAQSPTGTDDVTVVVPRGSAANGRQAFLSFRCHTCHRVPSDRQGDLPTPVSASPGPDLGLRQTQRGSGYVATAIISPSHEISLDPSDELAHDVDDVASPMGDYSHLMTIRQLVDLVAYLEPLPE